MKALIYLIAAPVLAHTLYFLPAKFKIGLGETLVFSIHNGDAFPASEEAVTPERLLDCRLISRTAVTPVTDFRVLGRATHAVVKMERAGSHWLAVRTRPNSLMLPAEKFESYLREEGLEWAIDWRKQHHEGGRPGREQYTKHAKSLIVADTPSEDWRERLGLELEFVPESDPARLKPGATLPVQLLWRGQPAANIRVERAWASGGSCHSPGATALARAAGREYPRRAGLGFRRQARSRDCRAHRRQWTNQRGRGQSGTLAAARRGAGAGPGEPGRGLAELLGDADFRSGRTIGARVKLMYAELARHAQQKVAAGAARRGRASRFRYRLFRVQNTSRACDTVLRVPFVRDEIAAGWVGTGYQGRHPQGREVRSGGGAWGSGSEPVAAGD